MSKLTAMQEFELKVWKLDNENFTISNALIELVNEAKEKEKQQIIEAVTFGNRQDFYDGNEEIGNNYYNETFKTTNNETK